MTDKNFNSSPIKGRKVQNNQIQVHSIVKDPIGFQVQQKRHKQANYSLEGGGGVGYLSHQSEQKYLNEFADQARSGRDNEYENLKSHYLPQSQSEVKIPQQTLSKKKVEPLPVSAVTTTKKPHKTKKKKKKTASKAQLQTPPQVKLEQHQSSDKRKMLQIEDLNDHNGASKKVQVQTLVHSKHKSAVSADYQGMFNRGAAIRMSQQLYSTGEERRRIVKQKSKSKSKSKSRSKSKSNAQWSIQQMGKINKTDNGHISSVSQSELIYKTIKTSSDVKSKKQQFSNTTGKFFHDSSDQQQSSLQPQSLQDRRKQLGLDFLNSKQIDKLIVSNKKLITIVFQKNKEHRKQQVDQELAEQPQKKRQMFTPNQLQEIKKYMKEKKRFSSQVEMIKNQKKYEKQKQIIENLLNVAEHAKRNSLSSSKSHSRSPQRDSVRPSVFENQQQKLKDKFESLAHRYQMMQQHISDSEDPHSPSLVQLMSHSSSNNLFSLKESQPQSQQSMGNKKLFVYDTPPLQIDVTDDDDDDAIYHEAALRIQKVWRGYLTRKILYQYAEYIQEQMNADELEEEKVAENDGNNLSMSNQKIEEPYYDSNKPESEVLRQSDYSSMAKKELQRLKEEEQKKWAKMKEFIVKMQVQKDQIDVDEVFNTLLQFSEYNRENVLEDKGEFKIPETRILQQDIRLISPKKKANLKIDIEEANLEKKPQQPSKKSQEVQAYPLDFMMMLSPQQGAEYSLLPIQQISQVIQLRQQLVNERQKKEKEMLKDLLIQERISPRSFGLKESEIQRWGENEQAYLRQSKQIIKEGWAKTYETIQRTQRDLQFIQRCGGSKQKRMLGVSLSQGQLLHSQIKELKMNLVRSAYSDESLINPKNSNESSHSEIKPMLTQKSDDQKFSDASMIVQMDTFNSNSVKETQNLNNYIQSLEDVPLDMEKDCVQNGQIIKISNEMENQIEEQFPEPEQEKELLASEENEVQQLTTHLASVKQYLDEIKDISKEFFSSKLLTLINTPIGPSPAEILKFFRFTEDMIMDDASVDGGFQHQAVLGLECFAIRERKQDKSEEKNEFLCELERIHNKAIFDAFNEALDYYRPFGIKGRPLPWKVETNSLEFL